MGLCVYNTPYDEYTFYRPTYYNSEGTGTTGHGFQPSPTAETFYVTPVRWPDLPDQVQLPKSWRWFDIFRTYPEPKLLPLLDGYPQLIRRVQERYPVQQRAKQKRRAYVQRLYS